MTAPIEVKCNGKKSAFRWTVLLGFFGFFLIIICRFLGGCQGKGLKIRWELWYTTSHLSCYSQDRGVKWKPIDIIGGRKYSLLTMVLISMQVLVMIFPQFALFWTGNDRGDPFGGMWESIAQRHQKRKYFPFCWEGRKENLVLAGLSKKKKFPLRSLRLCGELSRYLNHMM